MSTALSLFIFFYRLTYFTARADRRPLYRSWSVLTVKVNFVISLVQGKRDLPEWASFSQGNWRKTWKTITGWPENSNWNSVPLPNCSSFLLTLRHSTGTPNGKFWEKKKRKTTSKHFWRLLGKMYMFPSLPARLMEEFSASKVHLQQPFVTEGCSFLRADLLLCWRNVFLSANFNSERYFITIGTG